MGDRRMGGQGAARRVCQNGDSRLAEVKAATAKLQATFKRIHALCGGINFLERFCAIWTLR